VLTEAVLSYIDRANIGNAKIEVGPALGRALIAASSEVGL
jgi:hypothetical protein